MTSESVIRKYEEAVKRYKGKYPYLSNTKLAELIVKQEKLKIGSGKLRKYIPDIIEKKPQNLDFSEENFDIPETYYKDRPPFIIPKNVNRLGVIGDIHIPYHDKKALKICLDYLKQENINGLLLNGDILDFYSISRFYKRPDAPRLVNEMEVGKEFFALLRKIFPNTPIYYKIGNHEERWEMFIGLKCQELWGIANLQFENLLELDKYSIELISNQRTVITGMLNILHGHEFKMFSGGVNVARSARLKAIDNVLVGHFHRCQNDIAKTLSDKMQGGFSIGCLCGLSPDFMPINNWSHGFALVKTEDDGHFEVENLKIVDGKIR